MSTPYKLEYIWHDGYQPTANLRSKTRIKVQDSEPTLEDCPQWAFDGSSTEQAEGGSSDCLLDPVNIIPDPGRRNAYLVMTEVKNADGSIHPSNTRGGWDDNEDLWIGLEQEYVLMDGDRPAGFPDEGYPGPQGPYYCAVGHGNVVLRELVDAHLDICLDAGLKVTGINAEVMLGQWEYQIFGMGAKNAADAAVYSRYLLHRTAEQYGVVVDLHPKPVKGDWNGSGMHCNFSTTKIREGSGDAAANEAYITSICEAFRETHAEHIAVYGAHNEQRLTGLHETQSIDQFSYGASDRGASIRIPIGTVNDGWKGYLEDRRPASNADPYQIIGMILATLAKVDG